MNTNDSIMPLVNNHAPYETLRQAIREAQARNHLEDNNTENFVSTSSSFEKDTEFVEKSKKARMEEGLKKMDWVACFLEEFFSYTEMQPLSVPSLTKIQITVFQENLLQGRI